MNLSAEVTQRNEHCIEFDFSSGNENLTVGFESSEQNINADFGEIQFIEVDKETEIYNGAYSVTPKAYEQQLETENRKMTNNVTVKEIPYFEVSNSAGGNTLNIG